MNRLSQEQRLGIERGLKDTDEGGVTPREEVKNDSACELLDFLNG